MTDLEWVHELARLPEIVGITSRSSPAGESSIVEIYFSAPIDKAFILTKLPHTFKEKAIFTPKEEMKVSPHTYMKILYEREETLLSKRMIEILLKEASASMTAAKKAAARGDVHFVLARFNQTVNNWNHIIYLLNKQHLVNQEGAAKKAARMAVTPAYYLVRLEQAYTYFASHNPALGFDEFNRIHNEITQIITDNH